MSRPETISGTFQSFDETPIFYELHIASHSKKTPILFLYGLVCAMTQWRYQLNWFRQSRTCIFMDYRGHHRSGLPATELDLSIKNCVEDCRLLLDHLDLPPIHIVGHSLGSHVSLLLAAKHPEKVKSIVSVCGSVNNPFETMFHTHWVQYAFEFLKAYHHIDAEKAEFFWKKAIKNTPINRTLVSLLGFNPKLSRSHDIDIYLENVAKIPLHVFRALLEDMQTSIQPYLQDVVCPVLVVSGERDLILPPKNQRELFENLVRAQWMSIPYGSHCAHMDMHEFVNLRMEKFFDSVESKPKKKQSQKATP